MSEQQELPTAPESHRGEVVLEGRTLRWFRSPSGVWCVCADDAAPACACGLTIEGAFRQWERAQRHAE